MGCTCKGSKKPKTTLPLQVIKFSSQQEWKSCQMNIMKQSIINIAIFSLLRVVPMLIKTSLSISSMKVTQVKETQLFQLKVQIQSKVNKRCDSLMLRFMYHKLYYDYFCFTLTSKTNPILQQNIKIIIMTCKQNSQ
ncbi:unnamed protein product (macronuclear) [Paramecium tetraurelia]|uniref:Transmembrane protein n=1 Tax=Paramecium tetraurelia TaxID=5888 RepID=A0DCW3_PARTE|nr:uncharacterized protein GSPATT00015739001 [Paramecium tetraurelia]CAK80880.1 unnamed protein product [Paramecium tetraurelia]|eukprot:XP_001448277.1 hypothetical protein (macronuclear) [Paramecium tetraurelia strain d4-2]